MKNTGLIRCLPLAGMMLLAGCEVYTPQAFYPSGAYVDQYPAYIESEPAYIYPDTGYYGGYVAPPVVPVTPVYPYWQTPSYPEYYGSRPYAHAPKPHHRPAHRPYSPPYGYGQPEPDHRRELPVYPGQAQGHGGEARQWSVPENRAHRQEQRQERRQERRHERQDQGHEASH